MFGVYRELENNPCAFQQTRQGEFFPYGWKGKHCYHFIGKILSSLGSGPEWNSAQCFVKVKYALFGEGGGGGGLVLPLPIAMLK